MTLGLPRRDGVLAQELEGHLDGLGATRGQVDALETRPRERREPLGQPCVRRVPGRARVRVGEPPALVEHRLQDALVALSEGRKEGPGGHVEQPSSPLVDEIDALARDDRRDVGGGRPREEQVLGAAAGRAEVLGHGAAPRDKSIGLRGVRVPSGLLPVPPGPPGAKPTAPSHGRTLVVLAAHPSSAIDPHRRLPAEPLPAPQGHLDVERVDLHRVAAGALPLGGDERGP